MVLRSLPICALAFAVASCLSVEPTPLEISKPTIILGQKFTDDLTSHDVIIVGELHGTKEVPETIASLSRVLSSRTLFALELRPESAAMSCPVQEVVPSWQRKGADGRSSEAMLAMLCRTRDNAKNYGNEVLLFDSRGPEKPTFYEDAADAIVGKLRSGEYDNAIVLTGNYHARKGPDHLAGALTKRGLDALTATMSSPAGTAWNCSRVDGKLNCGPSPIGGAFCRSVTSTEVEWVSDVPAKFNWDRCLHLPEVTASPPADKTPTKSP